MDHFDDIKDVLALAPQTVDDDPVVVSDAIDTFRFGRLNLNVLLGVAGEANPLTTLKLSECDTSGGTYADIPAFTGGDEVGETVGFVIPASSETASEIFRFEVNPRKHKRYLKLSIASTAARTVAAVASLFRPESMPLSTAAAQGCALVVRD